MPVVRYANFKVYDPVYVAIDNGYFEKHGIQVEMLGDTLAGPTAIQAVASGRAEAGLSSIPAIINANSAGLPIVGVTDIQSALPGAPLEVYFVRRDSGIETLDDLRGKKFAVNLWKSSFHYTALMHLANNQISEEAVEFVLMPFADQVTALDAGSVDVIGLMEPYISQARAIYGDNYVELFNAEDVFGQKQFTLHFVNRIWARENPEQARAFVAGIVDAIAWIEAHPEEARPIIAKYTGVDAQFVPVYHFQEGGKVIEEDVQFWLDFMAKRGDLTVDWLSPADIGTNEWHPDANLD